MNDDQTHQVQRFFDAIDLVLTQKYNASRDANERFVGRREHICRVNSLDFRYTLRDGIIWEPYEDKKNNVSGWRPIRRRTIVDWFHRRKHGHDKDFVEQLPEGPVRQPAFIFDELWTWNCSLDPAVHALMLKQELEKFQIFALLASTLKPKLMNRTMLYEADQTFTNSMSFDMSSTVKWGIDWNSVKRFHQEVMQAMTQIP